MELTIKEDEGRISKTVDNSKICGRKMVGQKNWGERSLNRCGFEFCRY